MVADQVGQPLLHVERSGYTSNVAAAVLNANQQCAARRIGDCHDRLERTMWRGKITLELQRLALRPPQDLE
ncbi:MAG: hypothetical protein WEA24_05160 [Gemmatimonadota bacterium]